MAIWVSVNGFVDNQELTADTLNKPIYQLAERTNYLYQRLNEVIGSSMYESVRITDVTLETVGQLAPDVKDVVSYNRYTGKYEKAVASVSASDLYVASLPAYAIGILISKNGNKGTILVAGRLNLKTNNAPWLVSDLIESDEIFRPGPYYLSSVEPGKLTAFPGAIVVHVGYFINDTVDSRYGDYAIINVYLKDSGEGHVHRTYSLYTQPAGGHIIDNNFSPPVHRITGFKPEDASDPLSPRLIVCGEWSGSEQVHYDIWLSTYSGTDKSTSVKPNNFKEAWLHWKSSDKAEGSGRVSITGYEQEISIGKKGIKVALENPTGYTPQTSTNWHIPYMPVTDSVNKRSWSILVPDETVGWLQNKKRLIMSFDSNDNNYDYILCVIGGPMVAADKRSSDTITVRCGEIHIIDLTLPSVGDKTIIGSYIFEYTVDGSLSNSSNIPVYISGDNNNPIKTYDNLAAAIKQVTGDIVLVIDEEKGKGIILTPANTSVSHRSINSPAVSSGAGSFNTSVDLVVYDRDNRNLVDDAVNLYWTATEYVPVSLKNNLRIIPVYRPMVEGQLPPNPRGVFVGDSWKVTIIESAPTAKFKYSVGMHQALKKYYPPIPAASASLSLNGIELDNNLLSPYSFTYVIGRDSLYWVSDSYGNIPWPVSWVNYETPVEPHNQQKLIFNFIKRAGESEYVTSLRPAKNSNILIKQCGTNTPATTGDLEIDLNLMINLDDEENANLPGYRVVKGVSGTTLRRGPVVEKIIAGNGLIVTQNAGAPPGQGTVTISLAAGDNIYSGDFEEIALENAKQERIGLFPYIRLLGWRTGSNNIPTGFTAKFRVPHTVINKYYRVVIYATVFGEENIPYIQDGSFKRAGLKFTYSILPDVFSIGDESEPPTASLNLADNLIQPSTEMSVVIPFGNPSKNPIYKAYDPMLIHNYPLEPNANLEGQKYRSLGVPFPSLETINNWPYDEKKLGVRPGSLVAVRFSRSDLSNPVNEYTGNIGFINLRWMLVEVG